MQPLMQPLICNNAQKQRLQYVQKTPVLQFVL